MKRIAIIALAAAVGATAHAAPLHFDDLVSSGPAIKGIVNGYQGLNWQAVFSLNTAAFSTSTGYGKAAVSPTGAAMIGGSFGRFGSDDETFDLGSLYMTSIWRNGLNVLVEGVRNGSVVNSTTVVLNTTGPQKFDFNWSNLNWVRFTASGGTRISPYGDGMYFAFDDAGVARNIQPAGVPVPEPATLGLAAVGLAAALRRRARR